METGRIIAGKYRLVANVAAGGMGSVWRARHLDLETDVAVKLIGEGLARDQVALGRFKREARAAAQLKSRFVVSILDYGIEDGVPYMVMELLDGEDLRAYLDRNEKLGPARVREIIDPVGKALRLAHAAGLVHRDLKPANVFLARSGDDELVKVLDFGIAKEVDPNTLSLPTKTSVLLGSPLYMSPERARGDRVDHRADLWALSMIALEMLTGAHPFRGLAVDEVLSRVAKESIPTPSALGLTSKALDAFFARAFHADPDARFTSAAELTQALADAVERPADAGPVRALARDIDTLDIAAVAPAEPAEPAPLERPRSSRALAGVAIVAGVVGLAVAYASRTSPEPARPSATATTTSVATASESIPMESASAPAAGMPPITTTASPSAVLDATPSAATPAPTPPPRAAGAPQRRPAAPSPAPASAEPATAIDETFGVPVRKR
jgi:eukaryotic-like serine/threonine-protein kinase